eukprot:gene7743-8584_t
MDEEFKSFLLKAPLKKTSSPAKCSFDYYLESLKDDQRLETLKEDGDPFQKHRRDGQARRSLFPFNISGIDDINIDSENEHYIDGNENFFSEGLDESLLSDFANEISFEDAASSEEDSLKHWFEKATPALKRAGVLNDLTCVRMDSDILVGLHLRSIFCDSFTGQIRKIYSGCLIASSALGLIGSIFQMFLWKGFLKLHEARHKPSSNPHIVFNLAVASLVHGITFLLVNIPIENGLIPESIARQDIYWIFPIQILSDFGFICASIWTMIYLFDVCLQVHKVNCHVATYHATCWCLTTLFTVLIQVLRFSDRDSIRKCITEKQLPNVIIVWISVILALLILCTLTLVFIDRQVKADICLVSNAYTSYQRKLLQNVRGKFVFFVVVFFICWISTLAEGALILAKAGEYALQPLAFTEAILNPLQGAFNYFIFIPVRPKPSAAVADRKSPLLPRGTIQQLYGASFESSFASSFGRGGRNFVAVPSFHFTPCGPDNETPPMLRSIDNWSSCTSRVDSLENTLNVGNLLGEADY